jgi:hypothetical protein
MYEAELDRDSHCYREIERAQFDAPSNRRSSPREDKADKTIVCQQVLGVK